MRIDILIKDDGNKETSTSVNVEGRVVYNSVKERRRAAALKWENEQKEAEEPASDTGTLAIKRKELLAEREKLEKDLGQAINLVRFMAFISAVVLLISIAIAIVEEALGGFFLFGVLVALTVGWYAVLVGDVKDKIRKNMVDMYVLEHPLDP